MPTQKPSWYRQFALHVAIFSSLMAAVLSIVYCGCRFGFATPYAPVLRVTGLAFLILNVAPLGRPRWFAHPVALVLYTLAGVGVTSWFLQGVPHVGWLWSGGGYVLFAWNLVAGVLGSRKNLLAIFILSVAALICGSYASGKTWGLGYNNPLAEERLLVNRGHIDALFHSSISNMMRTYGQPSTGLDGVPYSAYHYGSHWLVAALAPVCGLSVFDFYNSGTGIIFIPLMYAALLLLSGVIRDAIRDPGITDYGLPGGCLFWLVILAGLLGPFPKKGDMMRVSLIEIYNSDSYALGLAISFLVIALAVLFYREWNQAGRPAHIASGITLLIVFPALYCLCALVKASMAYLLFGMAVYASIRLRLLRHRFIQLHVLISFAALLGLARFITSRGDAHLSFFTFDRIHPEWIPYFLVFYFFWVWAFVLLRWYQLRLQTVGDFQQAWLQGDTFSVEVLAFCTFIGLLPYLVLRFETGSWNYFIQYQTFLGIALTAGYLPSWPSVRPVFPDRHSEVPLHVVFAGLLASLFFLHLGITTFGSAYGLLKSNTEIRAELAGDAPDDWRSLLRSLYGSSRGLISPALKDRQEMLRCLHSLASMPMTQKRDSLLYIPKSNRAYWGDLRQKTSGEGAVSFLAPALTGIAMIDGEPEYDDLSPTRRLDYGFWSYPLPEHSELLSTIDPEGLNTRARKLGFHRVVELMGDGASCTTQRFDVRR